MPRPSRSAAYLGDLAEERRARPRDDLISALVAPTPEGDGLTQDELLTMAALLFAAGFETATHLLGNGLVALLDNPDQLQRWRSARREPGRVRGRRTAAVRQLPCRSLGERRCVPW